jgi:hypothetical protein
LTLSCDVQIAVIVTDKDLNELDEGIEFIVKTEKEVLDKMNDWCVLPRILLVPSLASSSQAPTDPLSIVQVHQAAWQGQLPPFHFPLRLR